MLRTVAVLGVARTDGGVAAGVGSATRRGGDPVGEVGHSVCPGGCEMRTRATGEVPKIGVTAAFPRLADATFASESPRTTTPIARLAILDVSGILTLF